VAPVLFGSTAPTSELLEEEASGGRTAEETEDRAVVSPGTLLDGEGGRMGFRVVEASFGPGVAVMMVVEEEVRVTGQTVVETGTIIVLTGQSSVPGPHP
jgi:hypothetical protein